MQTPHDRTSSNVEVFLAEDSIRKYHHSWQSLGIDFKLEARCQLRGLSPRGASPRAFATPSKSKAQNQVAKYLILATSNLRWCYACIEWEVDLHGGSGFLLSFLSFFFFSCNSMPLSSFESFCWSERISLAASFPIHLFSLFHGTCICHSKAAKSNISLSQTRRDPPSGT